MATPYCDFTHFQYSFSAAGACFILQVSTKLDEKILSRGKEVAENLAEFEEFSIFFRQSFAPTDG